MGLRPVGVRGFTLLELLIAISIMLLLAAITFRLLNSTLDADRVRTGSRELQSFLAGARDRAIYAGEPRGVRFIPDPYDTTTVRSFVYIGAATNYTDGQTITPGGTGNRVLTLSAPTRTEWKRLWDRQLLANGVRIQIGGTWHTLALTPGADGNPGVTGVDDDGNGTVDDASELGWPTSDDTWTLTRDQSVTTATTYQIQLVPAVLAGENPRTLPQGIVIDLENSSLPASWAPPYAVPLDLLFSPNGTVTGTAASAGRIHFVLGEFVDASVPGPPTVPTGVPLLDATSAWAASTAYMAGLWVVPSPQNDRCFRCITAGTTGATQPPEFATALPGQTVTDSGVTWECFIPKPRLIVSLATRTGRITTHPVDPIDRFRFAEVGEVTQ